MSSKESLCWRWFHRRVDVVLFFAGFFFCPAKCFPNIPLIETYTKETKVGKLGPSFFQNEGTAAATSSDLRSFLPKTVKFPNDRGKRVSDHRCGAGEKIALLNEYTWDLVFGLIVPGKLLLLPSFDRSLGWFVVILALLCHFLVARATRHCRYSFSSQRHWLNKSCTAPVHVVRRSNVGLSSPLWLVREIRFVRPRWIFLLVGSLDTAIWASSTRFWPHKYAYNAWPQPTPTVHFTACCLQEPCPAFFRKARQLWKLSGLLSPCDYFQERRKHQH